MTDLVRDVRFSLRSLRRSPGLALAALLALGLGVGATAAIYTVVDAVLLEPLPYPQPDELVMLIDANPEAGFPRFSDLAAELRGLEGAGDELRGHGRLHRTNLVLNAPGADPERISGRPSHGRVLPGAGQRPVYGRTFTAAEDLPGGEAVAVLGNGLWRRRFGGDPGSSGRR